jgi:hypothetical protein
MRLRRRQLRWLEGQVTASSVWRMRLSAASAGITDPPPLLYVTEIQHWSTAPRWRLSVP